MLAEARVLVVEDDAGIRMTLEDLLASEGCVVKSAADGISGEAEARSGSFDLMVLDLMLPGRDGLAVCSNLRAAGLDLPILMLTARNTDLDVVIGLREGADDYLAKPYDSGVLIARLEALLRRAAMSDASAARGTGAAGERPEGRKPASRFGDFLLDRERGDLLRDGEPVALNAQEYRLLDFLVARPGRVIGRDEILDLVWGYDSDTTTRTVDVHIAKLRQRLGESALPRHILTIRGRGYKFAP